MSGKIVAKFINKYRLIQSVSIKQNSKYIISGGKGEKINIWNIDKKEKIKELVGHKKIIMSVAYN